MIVRPGISEEVRWFAEARFGLFVHFGVYALLGRGEWVMYEERIPRAEYKALASRFDPRAFSAEAWVDLAIEAGARYITCTAKHHDGFCLFDSALTDWKITRTPFARDLVGELVAACQRRGLRIILYYSQPDWMHPAFVHRHGAFKDWPEPRPEDTPDWNAYLEYYLGQVRELCTQYGRIDGIWFDGSHKTVEDWRGAEVYALIKQLQPGAVVNDRARCGDFYTPERHLPDDLTGYLFEACESTSPTAWGYQGDTALFSVPHLVEGLVRTATAGGNYLLNVGPGPDGAIPEGQAERLRGVGRWLARHGESIYGSAAGPALDDPEVRISVRSGAVYLHFLRWPRTDRVRLPQVQRSDVLGAALVGGGELRLEEHGDGLWLCGLPAQPAAATVQVVRLELARLPASWQRGPAPAPAARPVTVSPDKPTVLRPEDAACCGRGVKGAPLRLGRDPGTGRTFLTGWMTPDQVARWELTVSRAGRYRVSAAVRPPRPGLAGASLAAVVGTAVLTGAVPEPETPGSFAAVGLGEIELATGRMEVTLRPGELRWGYLLGEVAELVVCPVAASS